MPGKVAYAVASYWLIDPDVDESYWQRRVLRPWTGMLMAPARWLALRILARERNIYPLALEHVACVSEYVLRKLTEAGALPHGAHVIYNGIDQRAFVMAAERRTRRDGTLRLVYTGGLLTHKGVHTAIEALGLLQQRGEAEGVSLTLVGDGHPDYEAHLRQLVAELALNQHVFFRGRVPREEVPDILGTADVFLFTSVWEEPIARSVMEAMAAGLAVIGTGVGGQREMLEDGVNALVFAPEDAEKLADCVMQLKHEPKQRVALAEAGQRMVLERFTLEHMVDEMEAWLEAVVG
jgi:glycosyltransferase involved in cell wall biosynthesis